MFEYTCIDIRPTTNYNIILQGYILMCSTRNEQHPTVSADSSASFSLPALSANLSIKYIATALKIK